MNNVKFVLKSNFKSFDSKIEWNDKKKFMYFGRQNQRGKNSLDLKRKSEDRNSIERNSFYATVDLALTITRYVAISLLTSSLKRRKGVDSKNIIYPRFWRVFNRDRPSNALAIDRSNSYKLEKNIVNHVSMQF